RSRPAAGARRPVLRQQRGRHRHRDDPAQGQLRQHRQCALAGAVRRCHPHPHHRDRRPRRPVAGHPDRATGHLRLRRQARPHRRVPSGDTGTDRRPRHRDHQGPRGGRACGDRRAAQPRARHACRRQDMSPELFIRRPVMTWLVMAGILIFGIFAYRLLPVSDLPNVDFPTIQVSASLPGASPDTMASAVATPLERQFSTIAGIDSMTSSSALGLTQITVQFSLERNIDAAAQDVQAAITAAAPQLPPGMPTPPSYKKVNPADQPVLYLALSSPTLPLYTVDEYAQTNLAQRISQITGVAQVQVFGSQKYAVRVQLDPNALATRGIGIDEVQKALAQSNVNLPTGTLYGPYQAFSVQATGQLTNAAAYRPLIVAYRNGSPVRLEQLGRVVDSV